MSKMGSHDPFCRNPNLGLPTKARGWKVAGQEEDLGITSHAPRVQRVWGHEPSHSQVNSHVGSWSPERTPKSSERNCRGQNSSPWGVLYIIRKLLKRKFLKWARIAHLDIYNTSYGQKNGRESNCQFDSRPLKVRNRPDFVACKRRATYRWKVLDKGYNFASNLIVIGGFHKKLCAFKVARVPIVTISGLPLGSLGTKSHLDVIPMERCRITKGRMWWLPPSPGHGESCVSGLLVVRPNTKNASTMH
jgi:hypothetical protein